MSHHQLLFVSAASPVKLLSTTIQRTSVDPADAYAGIRYSNAAGGPTQRAQGTTLSWTSIDSWLLQGAVGDYEFRALVATGPSTPTGTLNTWVAANVLQGPNWYLARTTVGSLGCILTIEARLAVGGTVVAVSSVILRAFVDA